ncbi:MAG TPA: sulfite exporter TauE/SafE family protein [Acidimicrobiales bacterium]
MITDLAAVVLGLLTGILSGAFGVGGAVISTPGIRLLGASAYAAVGTTLPPILPGAISGTIRYSRDRLVDWKVVAGAAPAGVVAAVVGSLLSHGVPGDGHWLMVLTAVLIGLTAIRTARMPDEAGRTAVDTSPVRKSGVVMAAVGAAGGMLSGLLGLGGALALIPGFNQILRLPIKTSVATSLACVGILAVPSTITHALLGDIDWRLALLLSVGVVPGARMGASLSVRATNRRLRLAVAGFLGLLSVVYGVSELVALLGR